MERITKQLTQPLRWMQRRFRQSRPGSVLILVVALLVLLALMGTAYVTSARLERFASINTNSQRMLNEAAIAYAHQLLGQVEQSAAADSGNVVTCPTDSTVGASFLASLVPTFLPDLVSPGSDALYPTTPVWPSVSRLVGYANAESPYKNKLQPSGQYIPAVGQYLAPTNIVIHYLQNSALGTDPSLVGQTRTFPAFWQFTPDPTASPPTTHLRSGPFLAGDATGSGIADCAMVRLTSSAIQGINFYGGVYVVDNAAKLNLNTAWTSQQDVETKTGNSFNHYASDIDLLGFMNANTSTYAAPTEMVALNKVRFQGGMAVDRTAKDDANVLHPDVKADTDAEAFWFQLAGRLGNPNGNVSFGNKVGTKWVRPFADVDTAAVGYHQGLIDLDNPLALIDQQMSTQPNDSIYLGAANNMASAANRWRSFAANNVGYWYDWYWNFDNVVADPRSGMYFPIAAGAPVSSVSGFPFRTPRTFVVGANPVANICTQIPYAALTANVPQATTVADPNVLPLVNPGVHPHKASLNTGLFPELWGGFINVMASYVDPSSGVVQFFIPGDPLIPPVFPASLNQMNDGNLVNQNQTMFRNVLRGVKMGSTTATMGNNATTGEPIKAINIRKNPDDGLDSKNVMLLRAALAASNVQTLRNGFGAANVQGTQYFAPDVARNTVTLKTYNGSTVQAVCYGVGAHPYITEVFASTDQNTYKDANGNDINNDNGLVVIKLYNPYPFALSLKNYQFGIIDRRATGGTYPSMKVNHITLIPGSVIIPAQGTYLLTNYDNTPKNNYWPAYLGTLPSGTTAVQIPALANVFEGAKPTAGNGPAEGGELVLLSPLTALGTDLGEVPVDCYDFTGLKIDPANQKTAVNWHYTRTAGNAPDRRWKCVYAGEYSALLNATSTGIFSTPRFAGTDMTTEYTMPGMTDPWLPGGDPGQPMAFDQTDTKETTGTSGTPSKFPGIELCNVDFGGFNKRSGAGPRAFPYGAFARVGDVVQAPFIGSYFILPSGVAAPAIGAPLTLTAVLECNPVSIDATLVDDNDTANDAKEHLGRFIPYLDTASGYDDYSRNGYYGTKDPDPDMRPVAYKLQQNINDPSVPHAKWRYHWTMGVLDQFTTVSNPESAWYPNVEPNSWGGTMLPRAVTSSPGGTAGAGGYATEGLININSASWRVLAAMEMIPKMFDANGSQNAILAKAIVRYRDVDDGIARTDVAKKPLPPQGHGPFKSVMELNKVFLPGTPTSTFQNAFGLLVAPNAADPTFFKWGNYAPGPTNFKPDLTLTDGKLNNKPVEDWTPDTLMVRRISNLVTLRSDSFTAYVVVQGWRNAGTDVPELVIQKRLAVVIDRSQLGNAGGTVRTYNVPTD